MAPGNEVQQGQKRSVLATVANFAAKFLAFVSAILFVIVTVGVLLLVNAERQLLRPDLYKRTLAEQRVYERLPALVAEQIVRQTTYSGPGTETPGQTRDEAPADQGGGLPEQVKHLSQADYEGILSDLLPTPWLQTQTESAIEQAFAYLHSDAQTLAIKISLVDVKTRVAGDEGVHAALRIVRSWPPCTKKQMAAWAGARTDNLPTCRPPEETLGAFTPKIKEVLSGAATQIPDELDLTQAFQGERDSGAAQPSGTKGSREKPREDFQRVLRGVRLSPLLPVVLLLLVTLFGVRSVRGLLRWWGIPLLMIGLAGIGLAMATLPMVNRAVTHWDITSRAGAVSGNLVQAGLDVERYIVRTVANRVAVEGTAIALIGLALLVISFRQIPQAGGSQPPSVPE